MAREKSPLSFAGSLEVEMQGALDARRNVVLIADLTDENSFPYIYKGLDVFCQENGKWYTFMGGDKTSMSNWREEGTGGGGTSDFNDLTNRPKYLGDAMTNKTDVMGFELIEDHDGCYWYDDAYTWMGAWKKTPSGGATGHGMVVSRGQREIGLIKGDAGGSSSQRWRIPMADKVEDMLAKKADKATTYTKTETDGKIAEAMTDVDNEHFHPVTALPDPADEDPTKRPKENHEYILIEYEQDGTTIKSETHYLFYGGEYHEKKAVISLDGYATEAYVLSQVTPKAEIEINESSNAMDIIGGGRHASFNVNTDGNMEVTLAEPNVYLKTAIVPSKTNMDNALAGKAELNVVPGDDKVDVTQGSTGFGLRADNGGLVFDIGGSDILTLQPKLESGVNIKTVNGASLLGSGNIPISGGSGSLPQGGYKGQALVKQSMEDGDAVWGTPQFDTYLNENSTNAVQNKVVAADIKTRARGWIDHKILTYFTTNEGEEQLLPTTAGQIIEVESGMGMYRATLTQADIDGINAATATTGHIVRVYFEYDETDFYDVEVKNTGGGKGYYALDTGLPDPDYRYPGLPGRVFTETVYQIDKRLIPDVGTVDQTYDATSTNAQSGKAVAEAVAGASLPAGGTTGQILTKRSDADGDYGWQTHGAFTKDGDWWYKINPDDTFEAYYYKSGVSLTIQDNSGNFYRSALQTLNLPTGITSAYNATPLHASVNTSHNNYPCFGTLASVTTNQVKYYALSGSSRGASPNYIVTAHVFGTLVAKA